MIFDVKPLEDIEESDLQTLLVNAVPERKRTASPSMRT